METELRTRPIGTAEHGEANRHGPGSLATALRCCGFLAIGWCATQAKADPLSFVTDGSYGSVYVENIAGGGGTVGMSLTPGSGNGLNGVLVNGSGTDSSGYPFGETDELVLTETGFTNDGSFAGALPVSWDFSLGSDTPGTISWELYFGISSLFGTENIFEYGSAPGGQETRFQGSDSGFWSGAQPLHTYTVTLFESQFQAQATPEDPNPELSLDMNVNSIQINAVPEPMPLVGLSVGLLGCLLRRRRAS